MRKYELSISKNYVEDWTVSDAVREFIQNAIDQEIEIPDNKMTLSYVPDEQTIRIENKNSVLNVNTLLLGVSTKRDNSDTIGQFGEGYKIASLVLIREGKEVTIYNYGKREVWRPRFVNSRRYGQDILTFFVDTQYIWDTVPNNNLIIEIKGITPVEYRKIQENTLNLQDDIGDIINTKYGDILLDAKYRGRVFINGLYVYTVASLHYGYNVRAEYLKLGRDRNVADTFNCQWLTSAMALAVFESGTCTDLILDMVEKGYSDVRYVMTGPNGEYTASRKLKIALRDKFLEEYGADAIPVDNDTDYNFYRDCGNIPIIKNSIYTELLKGEIKAKSTDKVAISNRLEKWLSSVRLVLNKSAENELRDIIKDLKDLNM